MSRRSRRRISPRSRVSPPHRRAGRHERHVHRRAHDVPVSVLGYLGVPVAFSLLAGTLIGAIFTDVSHTAIIQKMFDGMDNEALLAIPFFLLVGELMSSANVVQRVANLSLSLVGHIRGG